MTVLPQLQQTGLRSDVGLPAGLLRFGSGRPEHCEQQTGLRSDVGLPAGLSCLGNGATAA